jgi:Retrotransposon gag protein/Zinc knuckle
MASDLEKYVVSLRTELERLQQQTLLLERKLDTRSEAKVEPRADVVRPPNPETFSGQGPAPLWVFQLQQYMEVVRIDERMQVAFAATLLRGNAAQWWRNRCESGSRPADFGAFSTALREAFQAINPVKKARQRLAQLRQTGPVQSYAAAFRSVCLEIPGITPEEMLDRFVSGLRTRTRVEVEIRDPADFETAARMADRVDNILFTKPIQNWSTRTQETRTNNWRSEDHRMEIDTIETRKRLSEVEKHRLLRLGACFYCRKPGHRASECPAKKSLHVLDVSGNEYSCQ